MNFKAGGDQSSIHRPAFAGSARQQTVSVRLVSAGRGGVTVPHEGQPQTASRKLKGKRVKTESTRPTCRSQGRRGVRP